MKKKSKLMDLMYMLLTLLFLLVMECVFFPVIWGFIKNLNSSMCNNAELINKSSPRFIEGCFDINNIMTATPLIMITMIIMTIVGAIITFLVLKYGDNKN